MFAPRLLLQHPLPLAGFCLSVCCMQALVTPSDNARWAALRKALEGQTSPPSFPVDDRVLLMAKQRVALAAKVRLCGCLVCLAGWCSRHVRVA